jgi:hypothetical protein
MNDSDSVESFNILLNWRTVLIEEAVYPWHKKPQKYLKYRELINGPRVYRWAFKNSSGEIEAVYIGESEKFENRLAGYRRPTSSTPNRTDAILNGEFANCEKREGTVELQFLEFVPFEINGQRIEAQIHSFAKHEIRLLLECIAIVTAKSEKPKLLNRLSEDAGIKAVRHILKTVSPEQQVKLIESGLKYLKSKARDANATQK